MDGARAASRLRVVLGHLGCPSAGAVVSFGLRGARAGRVVASRAIADLRVGSSPASAPGSPRWAQPFRAPGARGPEEGASPAACAGCRGRRGVTPASGPLGPPSPCWSPRGSFWNCAARDLRGGRAPRNVPAQSPVGRAQGGLEEPGRRQGLRGAPPAPRRPSAPHPRAGKGARASVAPSALLAEPRAATPGRSPRLPEKDLASGSASGFGIGMSPGGGGGVRSGVGSRKMSLQHRTRKSNPFIELYLLLRLSVLFGAHCWKLPIKLCLGLLLGTTRFAAARLCVGP